jgi:hypothetical protein
MDSSGLRAESERTYKGRYVVGLLEVRFLAAQTAGNPFEIVKC